MGRAPHAFGARGRVPLRRHYFPDLPKEANDTALPPPPPEACLAAWACNSLICCCNSLICWYSGRVTDSFTPSGEELCSTCEICCCNCSIFFSSSSTCLAVESPLEPPPPAAEAEVADEADASAVSPSAVPASVRVPASCAASA